MPGKIDINLQATANTSTIDEDIKPFGDQNAPHILNTGVLQDGGITNLYEQEEIYAQAGEYYITDDNEVLSAIVDPNDANKVVISLEGKPLGSVSAYGIRARHKIQNVDDVVITDDDSYLTCKLSGGSIIITEYDLYTGAQKNARSTVWTNLDDLGGFYTSLSFVRYDGLSYADSLEFVLRVGDGAIRLQESNLSMVIFPQDLQTSNYISNADSIVELLEYNGLLVVVTSLGLVFSFDGAKWKFPDGTGSGSGFYYASGVTGVATYGAIVFDGALVIYGTSGAISSYKNGWRLYNGTGIGQGPYNDGTHSGSVQTNCAVTATVGGVQYVVFGNNSGRVSSFSTVWHNYNSGTGISNNATVVGAENVTAIGIYPTNTIVVGSSGGRVGNYADGIGWTTYLGGGGATQPYNNAVVVGAVSIVAIVYVPEVFGGLAVVSNTRVGSYLAPGGWHNYDGTGTGVGVYKNTWAPALGASNAAYVDFGGGKAWLVVAGLNGIESYSSAFGGWTDVGGLGPRRPGDASAGGTLCKYGRYLVSGLAGVYQTDGASYTNAPVYSSFPSQASAMPSTCVWNGKLYASVSSRLYRLDHIWVDLGVQFSTLATAQCMCVYGNYLCFADSAGNVSSFDGTNIKLDDGTGTGTGPYNDGTAIGNSSILAICSYSGNLIIAGAGGKVASWNGAVWRAYNSGTQISNNATVLGAVNITWLHVYNGFLIAMGANGRVGSYDGANWKNYDATGTGTGPYNNATAVGNYTITNAVIYNGYLCVATQNGTLGSWDGTTWYNYNGSTGIYSNQSLTTAQMFTFVLDNALHIVTNTNNQKYVTAWSTTQPGGIMSLSYNYGFCNFQNGIFSGGYFTSSVNYVSYSGRAQLFAPFFGIESNQTPYVFRQTSGGASYYLCVFNGSNQSIGVVVDFANKRVYRINAKYAVRATNVAGGVYHYVSGTPQYYLTSLEGYGKVGAITSSDFRQFPTYDVYGFQVRGILQYSNGYGYSETLHRRLLSATNVYNVYAPTYRQVQSTTTNTDQTQTNTRIDGYGKLINNGGTAPTAPLELRCGMINAEPSFISAAQYGTSSDCVGTLLTNVGEFDPTYGPQIEGDKNILYRSGSAFIICALDSTVSQRFERINEHLYKINTISPSNLYDTLGGRFHVASSDYNGRMLITSTAVPAVSSTKIVGVQVSEFASSIDTGDKLITITSPTRDNYEIVGYILPDSGLVPDYAVDVYIADVYYASSRSDGTELVDPTKSGTLYLTTSSLPVAIGYPYNNGSLATLTSTVLLVDNYDGYEIGNELAGEFIAFQLFGQLYLFDGYNIYLANVQGGIIQSKTVTAPAQGLRYVAISPTEAVFCSDFDNSLHIFNGGRTLQKSLFLNRLDPILSGSWSVRDNSLLLDTASTFIFVRDGKVTTLTKAADQSGLRIYTTTDGLVVGNNTGNWQYSYKAIGTVLPLDWQSAYFGLDTNNLAYVQNAVLVIQSPTRARLQVVANIQTFDEDTYYRNESAFDILPSMYNDKNVVRVRVQPPTQRGLAVSVGAEIDGKAVLAQATIDFTEDTTAGISAKATR